jgi:hypothetical protein
MLRGDFLSGRWASKRICEERRPSGDWNSLRFKPAKEERSLFTILRLKSSITWGRAMIATVSIVVALIMRALWTSHLTRRLSF